MGLTGKLEIEVEIKSPADKFYNTFRRNAHHIPNICSDKVHKIDVHEGDWETPGSVKNWGYTLGKPLMIDHNSKPWPENVFPLFLLIRPRSDQICYVQPLVCYVTV